MQMINANQSTPEKREMVVHLLPDLAQRRGYLSPHSGRRLVGIDHLCVCLGFGVWGLGFGANGSGLRLTLIICACI